MDPGTAVGVVSLGIQVCDGLLKYYQDWKSYAEDIRDTYMSIEALTKTLTSLSHNLQAGSQNVVTTQAQELVTACQDRVQQLNRKLKKLRKEAPVGLGQQVQAVARRFIYPLRKSTLKKLKEIAQETIQQLELAIQVILIDNSHLTQHTAEQIQSTVDTTEVLVIQVQATTLDTQTQVIATAASMQVLLAAEEAKYLAIILTWLSAPDPSTSHTQALAKHEARTGEWLFRSQEYQDWISGSSPLLWLHGKAGCCKTTLCSTIIEHVSSQFSGLPKVAFAYFYFSFSDAQKQDYTNMLRSMVTQLSRGRNIHPLLSDAYLDAPFQKPSSKVLEPILAALLKESETAYLVVDALDECSEEQREHILEGFKRITHAFPKTKLLITSRKEADIEDLMTSWCVAEFPIDEAGVNDDIDIYVKNALVTDKRMKLLPRDVKREIEDVFHKRSGGMFRWAALQLDDIRSLKIMRPIYVSKVLYQMPKTLDETYARILAAIDDLYFDEARAALEWIAFSKNPLSVAELADACSIRIKDTQEPSFEEGGYEALVGLLSVLSSLIAVENVPEKKLDSSDKNLPEKSVDGSDEKDYTTYLGHTLLNKYDRVCYSQTVRLSHFSVKEYLVSSRLQQSCDKMLSRYSLQETEVHRSLGRRCCAYLYHITEQDELQPRVDEAQPPRTVFVEYTTIGPNNPGTKNAGKAFLEEFAPLYPLLPYVCCQWAFHQTLADPERKLLPVDSYLHIKVVEDEQVRIVWSHSTSKKKAMTSLAPHPCTSGLSVMQKKECSETQVMYWAAFLDLPPNQSLFCGTPLRQDCYQFALQCAATGGLDAILETIIACGVDLNHSEGGRGTALQAAGCYGHAKAVETLIAYGADVNCTEGYFGTALQAAAYNGYETTVDVLMANGADVECEGGFTGTALIAAASQGRTSIMSKLLQENLSTHILNFKQGYFGSALCAAAVRGYEQIVEGLLQAGADHREAMQKATENDCERVVQIFTKYRAVHGPAEEAETISTTSSESDTSSDVTL